jgi:hypothetical protein
MAHALKSCRGNRGITPPILPRYYMEVICQRHVRKTTSVCIEYKAGLTLEQLCTFDEKNKILAPTRIRIPDRPVPSAVTIPGMLTTRDRRDQNIQP